MNYFIVLILTTLLLSGCNSIPTEPNGQDVLVEINKLERTLRRIARLDTLPDISVLTTAGQIQKAKEKKEKENGTR